MMMLSIVDANQMIVHELIYQCPPRHIPRRGDAIEVLDAEGEVRVKGTVQQVTYIYPPESSWPTDCYYYVRVSVQTDKDSGADEESDEGERQPIPINDEVKAFLAYFEDTHGSVTRRIVEAARPGPFSHAVIGPVNGLSANPIDLSVITMTVIEKVAEGKVYVSGIAEARRATLKEMLETYREVHQ